MENNGKPIWEARYLLMNTINPFLRQLPVPFMLTTVFLFDFYRLDVQSCADCFLYYGGIAATISGQHIQLPNGSFGLIKREPLLGIKLIKILV